MGVHIQKVVDTKANINAIGAGNYKPQFSYFSSDTGEWAFGLNSGNLSAWVNPSTIGTPYTFTDTATVDFTNSSGTITAAVKLDPASDNDISATASGLYSKKVTIAAGSASYLAIDSNNVLSISALGIVRTYTDSSSTSLSAALTAAGYTSGNLIYQNGDTLILTAATGGTQIWLHNGGTAGTSADFVKIEGPDLSASYIYGLFSATNPISYNKSTGAFSFLYENGLNVSGGKLVLGGALTADTAFTGNFNLLFNLGASQKVTVGSSAGASRFNVDGDLEITDNTKGIVLKNGTARWRLTVDANGSLTTTSI